MQLETPCTQTEFDWLVEAGMSEQQEPINKGEGLNFLTYPSFEVEDTVAEKYNEIKNNRDGFIF